MDIPPFTADTGPTVDIPDTPSDVFQLFFDRDLQEEIVRESNKYARHVMGEEAYKKWTPITLEEFRAFLGFNILMGIVHLPAIDDYWSRDPRTRYAPIADKIPRQRYRDISRYLHFVDNNHLSPRGDPSYDRLGKIRPLIEHISDRFETVYHPSKHVAVDEAMIKFQGRSSLKQYMPKKPVKRGIKVWVLGDSANGYFSKFQVYTGKQDTRETGLGEHVVKTLTKGLEKKNHHVFFDNFFTGVRLLEDLQEDGILGCGTVRCDRKGMPPDLKKPVLKKRYASTLRVLPGVCVCVCVCVFVQVSIVSLSGGVCVSMFMCVCVWCMCA